MEIQHKPTHSVTKIGRQSASRAGIQGRFDGILITKDIASSTYTFVSGFPVNSSGDGIKTDNRIVSVGYDFNNMNRTWDVSFYLLNQQNPYFTDRFASGFEIHHTKKNQLLLASIDHDILFNKTSLVTLLGNWTMENNSVISLTFDQRYSAGLNASNALQGQNVSLTELINTFSDQQIRDLALNSSPVTSSISVGIQYPLTASLQINTDASVNKLETIPASDNEYSLSMQLVKSALWKERDVGLLGIRVSNNTTNKTVSLRQNIRLLLAKNWQFNPRLRLDKTSYKNNALTKNQITVVPSLSLSHRWKNSSHFELENGLEWNKRELTQQFSI
jgi:hypothetical protein